MARILVVDDNSLIRQTIKHVLAAQGHEVYEAENGRHGEALALRDSPDVVVIDILMPEQEGVETIISLRRQRPGMRILAISGGGQKRYPDFLTMAKQFGAHATLAKPFDRDALVGALAPLLSASGNAHGGRPII